MDVGMSAPSPNSGSGGVHDGAQIADTNMHHANEVRTVAPTDVFFGSFQPVAGRAVHELHPENTPTAMDQDDDYPSVGDYDMFSLGTGSLISTASPEQTVWH
eukprot:comp222401_c0_seq1/m.49910 comp222401_c0_seq1/g.49910  ORF comp222401_c0_seq1/g.49910 comp222401_c0_seq1/m.49910 type:complete len:102 (-) comp222401_c0_seq1:132-437(-)